MKISRLAATMIALSFVIYGCDHHGNTHSEHSHEHYQDSDIHSHNESMSEDEKSIVLTLNGSAKWKMDSHTRDIFKKMESRVANVSIENIGPGALKGMGMTLRKDVDDLIAGCTMNGAAHDELHKYLISYIQAVDGLAKDGSAEQAGKVNELLKLYPEYFE